MFRFDLLSDVLIFVKLGHIIWTLFNVAVCVVDMNLSMLMLTSSLMPLLLNSLKHLVMAFSESAVAEFWLVLLF